MVSLHGSERQSKGVKEMNDKEKKLREALNEYFGSDVGDIANVDGETISYAACPARFERHIDITTVPHKLTFEERRKKLVDQLDKDLKEIDKYLRVTADGTRLYIYFDKNNNWICSLDECMNPLNELQLYDACLSVTEMSRITNALSEFSKELDHLKELYKNETI